MKLKIISFITIWAMIFNNFHLGGSILLTDIIYTFLALYMVFAIKKVDTNFRIKYLCSMFIFFMFVAGMNFLIYQDNHNLLSQYRFLFGLFILIVFYNYYKIYEIEHLKKFYIYFVLSASLFIILENVAYHLLHYHFFISFGDFNLLRISTDGAIPGIHPYIRSGGLLREPSWYVVLMIPSIYMFYKQQEIYKLLVVVFGIIFSTSSLGYIYLLFFSLYVTFLTKGIKKKMFF